MATPNGSGQIRRLLTLDGGGAKGFYTLGVLREVQAALGGRPLSERFDLIYGTSTGAIIGALLALGETVEKIHELYRTHIPTVMRRLSPKDKSSALASLAKHVFGDARFEDVKTRLGIVTANWESEVPMLFKSDPALAHGRSATFVPGFGCTIADAVQASCSAFPFFKRKILTLPDKSLVELVDGGYCANNPALFAVADAHTPLQTAARDIRLLSVGVGMFPEPGGLFRKMRKAYGNWHLIGGARLLNKTFTINALAMERLRMALFRDVPTVRINQRFTQPQLATDLLEHDLRKLDMLFAKGRESFGEQEAEIKGLLTVEESR